LDARAKITKRNLWKMDMTEPKSPELVPLRRPSMSKNVVVAFEEVADWIDGRSEDCPPLHCRRLAAQFMREMASWHKHKKPDLHR
jgi:hypothetical protein